jgi:uncharacterized protein (TIGR02147 family)
MVSIFDYTDYRKFLKDCYEQRKAQHPEFTYRHLAAKAGFQSPGFFTQVLQAKSDLSSRLIPSIAEAFGLKPMEFRYFELMVRYNQADTHEEKKSFFERMIRYKKGNVRTINPDEYEFYDKWYYSAIRAALHYYRFDGDCRKLARMVAPAITPAEAKKAVAVLERLGLIQKNDTGVYELTQTHITTGLSTDSIVINNFVINTLEIAKDAFYRFPKDSRSFSALTLSVSAGGYEQIKRRADAFRQEIIDLVKADTDIDRAYQVNIQIFPLSPLSKEPADGSN